MHIGRKRRLASYRWNCPICFHTAGNFYRSHCDGTDIFNGKSNSHKDAKDCLWS